MASTAAPATVQVAGDADFVPSAALIRLRGWMTTKGIARDCLL
jgi:hypothetical protein